MTTQNPREGFWTKANDSLASARSENANGRYDAAANRCYYAAFQAAIVALLEDGLAAPTGIWGHGYVQAQFVGQLITRRKVFSAELRSTLTELLELRTKADYDPARVS